MRIAFVAVSQTQALDALVHETGQGLRSFLDRWDTIASLPSLALLTLAGMTPARHERRYFETGGIRAPAPPTEGLTSSPSPATPRRSSRPTAWPASTARPESRSCSADRT